MRRSEALDLDDDVEWFVKTEDHALLVARIVGTARERGVRVV